jgi:hypothetical protein
MASGNDMPGGVAPHPQDEERLQGTIGFGDAFESFLAVSDPLVQQRHQLVALLPG